MLAIATHGSVAEAATFREHHLPIISRAEAIHGGFHDRLKLDENDRCTYEEAQQRLKSGQLRSREDAWWQTNKRALGRAELRYGQLFDMSTTGAKPDEANKEDTNSEEAKDLGQRTSKGKGKAEAKETTDDKDKPGRTRWRNLAFKTRAVMIDGITITHATRTGL